MRPTQKLYRISSPAETHYRKATCQEVDCERYANGWRVKVNGLPADLLKYITNSGRKFSEVRVSDTETWLIYPGGQQCFDNHQVSLEKPALYIVRDRAGIRQHTKPEHWVEENSENLDRIRKIIDEG